MAANIQRYMERRLAFPGHNIQEVCADLYMGHGTTLAGLVVRDSCEALCRCNLDVKHFRARRCVQTYTRATGRHSLALW